MKKQSKSAVGVIVARFQVPQLHTGHHTIISEVYAQCKRVCIVLGTTENRLHVRNPLSVEVRSKMLLGHYSKLDILTLADIPSDKVWSQNLDAMIAKKYRGRKVVLYGSRDSFIPYYTGKLEVREIAEVPQVTGTKLREAAQKKVLNSRHFRAGIMHGKQDRHPIVYPTVDIAIIDPLERKVLVGYREEDGGKYRFFGGFVDKKDASYEAAAKREAREEAGDNLTLDEFRFLGSCKIDDPRTRGTVDGNMTSFFVATKIFGYGEGKDDIEDVCWLPYTELSANLIDIHKPLGEIFDREVTNKT